MDEKPPQPDRLVELLKKQVMSFIVRAGAENLKPLGEGFSLEELTQEDAMVVTKLNNDMIEKEQLLAYKKSIPANKSSRHAFGAWLINLYTAAKKPRDFLI